MTAHDLAVLTSTIATLVPVVLAVLGVLFAGKKMLWTDVVANAAAVAFDHFVIDPDKKRQAMILVKHAEEAIESSPHGDLKFDYVDQQLAAKFPDMTAEDREHLIHDALTDVRAILGHFYELEEHTIQSATTVQGMSPVGPLTPQVARDIQAQAQAIAVPPFQPLPATAGPSGGLIIGGVEMRPPSDQTVMTETSRTVTSAPTDEPAATKSEETL